MAEHQKGLDQVTRALQTANGEIFILRDQKQRAIAEHGNYIINRNQALQEETEKHKAREEELRRAIQSLNNEKLFMQQDLNEMRNKIRLMERAQKDVTEAKHTPSPKKKHDMYRDGFDVQLSPLKSKRRKVQAEESEELTPITQIGQQTTVTVEKDKSDVCSLFCSRNASLTILSSPMDFLTLIFMEQRY